MALRSKKIVCKVDDREVNSKTAQLLMAEDGVEAVVQRLPLGDYEIDNKLLFERKTLFDFAASIKDGGIFRQACKLVSHPLRSVIILEGTSSEMSTIKMKREAMQGALITISIIFGIPILRSREAKESVQLILYTARQVFTSEINALPRTIKRPKGKRKLQLSSTAGLTWYWAHAS